MTIRVDDPSDLDIINKETKEITKAISMIVKNGSYDIRSACMACMYSAEIFKEAMRSLTYEDKKINFDSFMDSMDVMVKSLVTKHARDKLEQAAK